jgi:membrane-bound serine protease (ClpP class)
MQRLSSFLLACLLALIAAHRQAAAQIDDPKAVRAGDSELIVVGESLNAATVSDIRSSALSLRSGAGDRPVLILEMRPGAAAVEEVLELARFLSSADADGVRTVAWVPEDLTGLRAVLPLAADELVMHPNAELGDAAPDEGWDEEQQAELTRLLARSGNPRVSPALIAAMLDPATALVRVEIESASETREVRLATPEEAKLFRDAGVKIVDLETIKPSGAPAVFSGAQAAEGGFLVTHTARESGELAELYGLSPLALRGREVEPAKHPMLIKVEGQIDPLLSSYLMRQIDRAIEDRADLVIFEVDSPGGLLQESLDIAFAIADLQHHGIRTVAYVPEDAISGAAIISLGCDQIYLHEHARIGDAGPIMQTQEGEIHRAPEKIVSYLRTVMSELAERKHRPAALLMAMADRDLVVYRAVHEETGRVWFFSESELDGLDGWERGRVVPESAKELLLTVNGRRAHELKLAEAPVEDFDELKSRLGIPADVRVEQIDRTWLDDTVFVLNTGFITGFLFFLGILFLFVELHFTSGLFGILSALCFGVFFWSKFLGGTAGWLEVLLFMLGATCLLLEIFVIPGFGVFGVAGGLLILGALVMANVTFSKIDRGMTTAQTYDAMKSLGIALVAVIGAAAMISRFLPHIPMLNSMILTPPPPSGPGNRSSAGGERVDVSGMVGKTGTAVSMLRPSGKVRVEGKLLDAVTRGGFVAAGKPIEIVEVIGSRTFVRELVEEEGLANS